MRKAAFPTTTPTAYPTMLCFLCLLLLCERRKAGRQPSLFSRTHCTSMPSAKKLYHSLFFILHTLFAHKSISSWEVVGRDTQCFLLSLKSLLLFELLRVRVRGGDMDGLLSSLLTHTAPYHYLPARLCLRWKKTAFWGQTWNSHPLHAAACMCMPLPAA